MAYVISRILFKKFMDCPVEGAHPVGPRDPPTLVDLPVNTALPVVTGTMTVGSTLTTTDGTWTSTDPITISYQWKTNGLINPGAITDTYVVAPADVGAVISVTVTATNVRGGVSVTVNAGAGAGGTDPPVTVDGLLNDYLPIVTGTLSIGGTLTTTNGGWVGTPPPTFTYSWQRDTDGTGTTFVDIPGATSNTYLLVSADAGHLITSTVTATNPSGTVIASSGAVGQIASPVIDDVLPVISGAAVVGSTLTTTNGTWEGTPAPTFAYQWRRGSVNISGATATTYTLTASDLATMITCVVTGTNASGSVNAISNALGPVAAFANATLPVISGITLTGATLTTTNGTWNGTAANTYTYQWTNNGVNISGATSNSYVISGGDFGAMISVVVTATNPVTSASAAAIAVGPIVAAPTVILSNALVAKSASVGFTIGTLSISGGSGSYSYALTSNPGSLFAISGSNLNVAAALTGGTVTISVQATGGSPSPVTQNFTITVAALSLSASTIRADAAIGATVGTFSVSNGIGSYSYVLTDPSGKFVISGSNLNVATALTAGSYPISVTASGGTPTPVFDSFMLTVTVVAVLPVNTVLPVISGTTQVGSTLTTSNGTWTGTLPIAYSYQWQRNPVVVAATTSIIGETRYGPWQVVVTDTVINAGDV